MKIRKRVWVGLYQYGVVYLGPPKGDLSEQSEVARRVDVIGGCHHVMNGSSRHDDCPFS